jgi:hypothetical protein
VRLIERRERFTITSLCAADEMHLCGRVSHDE